MRVELFDFELPPELIAKRPLGRRDAARLLHVGKDFADRVVTDLPALLRPGDVLVLNDTKVIPARLRGIRQADRGTARIEVTLHKTVPENAAWDVFARPAKRLRPGDIIRFQGSDPDSELRAEVLERRDGEVRLRFDRSAAELPKFLENLGEMPLPPYLGRPGDAQDRDDYQTVYASNPGAVAAPTAGLHFTPELLAALAAKGIEQQLLTLHVGGGTFLPVTSDDTDDHVMHSEWGEIGSEAAAVIAAARAEGRRIVAVGTTVLRLLESAVAGVSVQPWTGETDIFIVPGYRFQVVDVLLSNFHLPRSTLFMLVSAFAGRQRMLAAYAHAMAERYRFYSYGDCCLLERAS
ncbi:MAG TPA: tRNA preQ1(34) S-adenosylmethionine ribosyltransferase-isomerase QueA [Alphaproteobacteria bacterium]|jgi:S-adenosylmethionine:tRNA ribosyltransferase-isomerase|nr:tRNA preQ1(34) S-adenosylmethionine ribosyltransferase-isomerase QueA [Alphaproteobacteria bacterium]